MKNLIINILSIFLLAAAITSCQKVIDVDLNSADPKVVIEGVIYRDFIGPFSVKLSHTGSYFDVNKFNGIPGATVIISDNVGTIDTLKENITGIYYTQKISATSGRTYTLQVNVNNEKYYASSTMPEKVEIDSVNYYKPEGLNFGPDRRAGGKVVRVYFNDPVGKGNYYRLKLHVNDTVINFNGNYLLYQDNYLDGNLVEAQLFGKEVFPGDNVLVELLSIDKSTYDYFNGLNLLAPRGGGSSAAPANPPTNVSEGAVGYFSAQAISRKSIKVK